MELYNYHPMDNEPTSEVLPVTWNDFVRAVNGPFSTDLALVKHPDTPTITPFSPVNREDAHGRQYNLVQIPPEMTEDAFLQLFGKSKVIYVGCIDKDASGPFYQQLPPEEQQTLAQFRIAGGGVQVDADRVDSLKTMMQYLSLQGQHIEQLFFTGHNHDCGYVASRLGQPLTKALDVPPCSNRENRKMKELIVSTSQRIGLENLFPKEKIVYGLEDIDRQGKVTLDTSEFDSIKHQGVAPLNEIIESIKHI